MAKAKPVAEQIKRESARELSEEIMIEHETERIRVKGKIVEVDVLMIPVVQWLNRLRGVSTFACCEGYDIPRKVRRRLSAEAELGNYNLDWVRPYVAFTCKSMGSLEAILRPIHPQSFVLGRCDVDYEPFRAALTFSVLFNTKDSLREYVKRLRRLASR